MGELFRDYKFWLTVGTMLFTAGVAWATLNARVVALEIHATSTDEWIDEHDAWIEEYFTTTKAPELDRLGKLEEAVAELQFDAKLLSCVLYKDQTVAECYVDMPLLLEESFLGQ